METRRKKKARGGLRRGLRNEKKSKGGFGQPKKEATQIRSRKKTSGRPHRNKPYTWDEKKRIFGSERKEHMTQSASKIDADGV